MMIATAPMSVILEVNAQEPCKGNGSNGRAVWEMMHPLNGQHGDSHQLYASGGNNRFFHDVKLKGPPLDGYHHSQRNNASSFGPVRLQFSM